jgi:hypothetical protein
MSDDDRFITTMFLIIVSIPLAAAIITSAPVQ